jgi:predicted AlkP superfamily pyrophosphatase or phosphodiesterase
MKKTVVINAVGLTPSLLGERTPRLGALAKIGAMANIEPVIPAVTCSVQTTYLTGAWPSEHGIVGNGWYFRDECEIKFWRQSNKLVERPKIWDVLRGRDSTFTCANIGWWYNMYSTADYTVTPRPMYPADGRKIPDIYTHPADLRDRLQQELGRFPLFQFWGPATSIRSSQWLADAAIRADQLHDPTLTLVYLPHLDYGFQRHGPDAPEVHRDIFELDSVCGTLIDHFKSRGATIIVLSEYGITPVSRPVHLNRVLREHGLLAVREELGRELLDAGTSSAFAVADHQIAHVYVNDPSRLNDVHNLIASTPGVGRVLDEAGKREFHLDHSRSGELIALAEPNAWFSYYYWLDDAKMPDFARTVDIHRKPGYDPAELFIDPSIPLPKLKIAWTLLRKKLGFRTLMKVIPPHGNIVRGSHGLPPGDPDQGPMLLASNPNLLPGSPVQACDVFHVIRRSCEDV